jgi:hypothetical protein
MRMGLSRNLPGTFGVVQVTVSSLTVVGGNRFVRTFLGNVGPCPRNDGLKGEEKHHGLLGCRFVFTDHVVISR